MRQLTVKLNIIFITSSGVFRILWGGTNVRRKRDLKGKIEWDEDLGAGAWEASPLPSPPARKSGESVFKPWNLVFESCDQSLHGYASACVATLATCCNRVAIMTFITFINRRLAKAVNNVFSVTHFERRQTKCTNCHDWTDHTFN